MREIKKQKLVYILPEYRDDIATHFYHNVELLELAQNKLDIFLIIEKGARPKGITRAYVQKFRFLPLRIIELKLILLALRLRGYKVFWTHYSFLGSILASFFGKSFYWNCGMPWLYKRGALEEYIFRLALRRSLLVIGTEGMKSQYIEHYHLNSERVHVLPNWINLERFKAWQDKKSEARARLRIAEHARVVLFAHRLSKRKGADIIVPVSKYFEDDPNILFLVTGLGPLEQGIRGKNIQLLGEVPQQAMPMVLASADMFFMPSEEEGFPHVVLEAMAMGVPIIASDVGGVREIVPNGARQFVINQNAGLFIEKIKQLLGDPDFLRTIGDEEKEFVKKYDINLILEEFLKLVG